MQRRVPLSHLELCAVAPLYLFVVLVRLSIVEGGPATIGGRRMAVVGNLV